MSTLWPVEFEAFRTLHPTETLDELTVVTPKELGRNYVLHISKNKELKTLIPYVCKRTQRDENRTIGRVSTAPTIAGCLIGYDTTIEEWLAEVGSKDGFGKKDVPWVGGWYIYAIPFEYALRPTNKLVCHAEASDEHWLVSYNKATWSYQAIPVGKLFYTTVTYQTTGKNKVTEIEMYIEVSSDVSIPFSRYTKLKKGYYRIRTDKLLDMATMDDVRLNVLDELTAEEYNAIKMPVASLLSFHNCVEEHHVPVLHW